ncbi:ester cyclase [Cysteiniphilum halobium]|uniref:nuclear transport factor 2 family protein n=1 Tax=Cysteiniphilum halobium TaxID=2219059 RepID=UPI003F843583
MSILCEQQNNTYVQNIYTYMQALNHADTSSILSILNTYFHKDANINISFPFNQFEGITDYHQNFWIDFFNAFSTPSRRDHIVMSGRYNDSDWVSATGEYTGVFSKSWLNIPATNKLTHIRYGEFYKIVDNKISECFILLDIIDVMQQADIQLLPPSLGTEQLFPAPATQDGIQLKPADEKITLNALKLVEDMIFIGLRDRQENEYTSKGSERYWHPNMLWYGPTGIGSTRGIDGFQKWHQHPFIKAFPNRVGGNHKARFAQGNYVCSTGWPSINATHSGSGWLGLAATNKDVTMRVMDFWRCEQSLLIENWVFIDILDVFNQLGYDLFERMNLHLAANHRG